MTKTKRVQNAKRRVRVNSGPIRAFKVEVKGFGDLTLYYAAESPGKARWRACMKGRDAGYNIKIGEVKVCRMPPFDDFANGQSRYLGAYDHTIQKFTGELESLNAGKVSA